MTSSISRLPPEILDLILSFVPIPTGYVPNTSPGKRDRLAWLSAPQVCHQWREIALNQPRFWSYIDFTALTFTGANEMLIRSKDAPLHLEADLSRPDVHWGLGRLDAFHSQLEAHTSHIRSLSITADPLDLLRIFRRLTLPAPTLESLSLSAKGKSSSNSATLTRIPHTLFDRTTPKLFRLELDSCPISWSSALLKDLRHLKLLCLTEAERPNIRSWLDAMRELSQLESLVVHSATPVAPRYMVAMPEPVRVVTLPCLTHLHLSDSANDCALALSHLVLPALTWLRVEVLSSHRDGDDIRVVIPHFARNAHGPQDKTPLQSIVINGYTTHADILLWTVPDADMEYHDNDSFTRASFSARAVFTASNQLWDFMTETAVYDAVLASLPMSSLVTLTVLDFSVVTRRIWLRYAPRWSSLTRVRLGCTVMRPFIDALTEDPPPEGPLLPSLSTLVTTGTPLTMDTIQRLRDMLSMRAEQGVPLQTLDLSGCTVTPALDGAMALFGDVVADARGPTGTELPPPRVVWPAPLVDWDVETRLSDWIVGDDDDDASSPGSPVLWPLMWPGAGGDDDDDEYEDEEEGEGEEESSSLED